MMVTFAVLVTFAAGCGQERSGDERRAAPGGDLSAAQAATVGYAQEILVARCMRAVGLSYVPAKPPKAPRRAFPYVIDDVAWARQHGFGSRRTMATRGGDPNRRYLRSLPAERRARVLAALLGPRPVGLSVTLPTGQTIHASDRGCVADAKRRLFGDLPRWFRADHIASSLQPLYMPQVRADPRYERARGRWARCMRGLGHRAADPGELREEPWNRSAGRRLEVRLAVAEATCAKRSRFGAVARALDRHYGDRVRKRYREEVDTRRRLRLTAYHRARAITAQLR